MSWADSIGRRNTSTTEVFNDGDGGLEQEDQRRSGGCASAVACRSGVASGLTRQQCVRLLGRGWTVAAARREVGVSRSTGNNWKNGYKVYRRGELVKIVDATGPSG